MPILSKKPLLQSSIIYNCILSPATTAGKCASAVSNTQNAIDNILQSNVEDLLTSLDAKMNKDGIIVLASYAPYFNNATNECATSQSWVFPGVEVPGLYLPLTQARQGTFNTLVANTNAKLKAAVASVSKSSTSTIVFADWSAWGQAVKGQFCEPGASGNPTDPSNSNVLFFKLNTAISLKELKRRQLEPEAPSSVSNLTSTYGAWAMEELDFTGGVLGHATHPERSCARQLRHDAILWCSPGRHWKTVSS